LRPPRKSWKSPAVAGLGANSATEIEAKREQRERHDIAQDSRQDQQHSGEHLASAVEKSAQQRLLAMHGRNRVGPERCSLIAQ
jgi:hypothetical protein